MPNSDSFGFDEITTQSTYVVQFNELRNRMINKNLGNVNAKRFFIYPQEGWNKELIETKLELLKNFFKEDGNIAINLFGVGDGFIFFSKNNSFVGHLIFQLESDEEDKSKVKKSGKKAEKQSEKPAEKPVKKQNKKK